LDIFDIWKYLLRLSVLDLGSGTGQTDRHTDR